MKAVACFENEDVGKYCHLTLLDGTIIEKCFHLYCSAEEENIIKHFLTADLKKIKFPISKIKEIRVLEVDDSNNNLCADLDFDKCLPEIKKLLTDYIIKYQQQVSKIEFKEEQTFNNIKSLQIKDISLENLLWKFEGTIKDYSDKMHVISGYAIIDWYDNSGHTQDDNWKRLPEIKYVIIIKSKNVLI